MKNFKRVGRVALGVGAVIAMAIAAAGPANADGTHVALYYSDPEGAWGAGNNAATEGQAAAVAKRLCIRNGGTDCRLASTVQNGCVALAVGPKLWAGGHGGSRGEADASALQRIGGAGSVEVSLCTARVGHPQIID
jgi:hypothetical protein